MLTDVIRGEKVIEKIDFTLEECCACGLAFMIPTRMQKALINSHDSFYCPNGHSQSYMGKSNAEKLQDELNILKNKKQQEQEDLQNKWLDALNENSKLEKKLKRIHNGVCPCCNRTFIDLQRHMKTKHPELLKQR